MATAAQIASAGTYITDDVGVEVTDGAHSRVQLGNLGGGSYGLRVVSSDGSTVIIDGTSDMFKIAATGTQVNDFHTLVGVCANSVTITLSGLGTFTQAPVVIATVAHGNPPAATDPRYLSPAFDQNTAAVWVGNAPGNPTSTPTVGSDYSSVTYDFLDISNHVVVENDSQQMFGGAIWSSRYYVLLETAL